MANIETAYDGGPTDDDMEKRYFDTFDNPNFNPRWANGIAAYVETDLELHANY